MNTVELSDDAALSLLQEAAADGRSTVARLGSSRPSTWRFTDDLCGQSPGVRGSCSAASRRNGVGWRRCRHRQLTTAGASAAVGLHLAKFRNDFLATHKW